LQAITLNAHFISVPYAYQRCSSSARENDKWSRQHFFLLLAGLIAGFDGKFKFESGEGYPPELKYGVMRFFNGVFGALVL
jgi:dolichyl-phosphate-mannose--protein O-mannosyl transferase